jgi:rhodanese-related sulfurtransferase
MKKLSNLILLSLTLSSPLIHAADGATPAVAQAPKVPAFKAHVLNRAELDALLATPEKVLLIDVRRPDEVTAIGGFPVYLSIQNKDLEKSLAFIPKDRTIVLVSNHAGRAGKAADLLTAKGYNVAGAAGVEGYEAEGGTIAKIVPPLPKQANAQTGAAAQ